jgi:DNA (cytosine-5)-methyltransferase 1
MTPTFGSLFAGVGGFDLGFESAGYECKFQVEWDKNCQQTLAYHWPDVPRWGDVSDVNGADLPPVDVITYGFPCQDLSNLFFQAVRIIKEMRQATNGRYPTFAVAENVLGLLNADGGSAMARVLDALAEAGAMVIEWCVLDAQWFGVPQRRRRVFVAACFDSGVAGRCPDPIFPVAPSGTRNPAARDEERQEVAGTFGGGFGSRGWSPDTDRMTFVPQRVTGTLAAGAHPGSYNGQDAYNDMLIPFVKARRAQNPDDYETCIADAPNPTLNEFDGGDKRTTTAIVQQTPTHDVVGPLTTKMSSPRGSETTDSHHVLPVISTVTQSIGFVAKGGSHSVRPLDNLSPTLKSTQTGPSVTQPTTVDLYNQTTSDDVSFTVRGSRPDHLPHITNNLAVRRLTPLECERLQGFPDNHTLYRADGKTNTDSTRYKQCGNGVAAPVAAWIAEHLKEIL